MLDTLNRLCSIPFNQLGFYSNIFFSNAEELIFSIIISAAVCAIAILDALTVVSSIGNSNFHLFFAQDKL
jgi:hypothetical protein